MKVNAPFPPSALKIDSPEAALGRPGFRTGQGTVLGSLMDVEVGRVFLIFDAPGEPARVEGPHAETLRLRSGMMLFCRTPLSF